MSSAWNWVGIFLWLFLIAYILWLIANVHTRKKRIIKTIANRKKSGLAYDLFGRSVRITFIEVLVLIVLMFGIGKTTFDHHLRAGNSYVTTKCEPLDLITVKPTRKHPHYQRHSYYFQITRSNSRTFKQKYQFMMMGKKVKASNKSALVITNLAQLKRDPTVPHRVQKLIAHRAGDFDRKYHKDWAFRITTSYRNTLANGVGMHAGEKKSHYTVIRLPKRTKPYLYVNNWKLNKKKKKAKMIK